MPQDLRPDLKQLLLSDTFRPALTLWNRLEGRPRQADFERSLRAEVRDPLWMLTRQWQFGEFKGEDAGSAQKAQVQLNTSRIDRFAVRMAGDVSKGARWQPAVPYDTSFPLETQVERERVFTPEPDPNSTQLAVRSQMGRHWLRLMKQAGLQGLVSALLQQFGFEDISEKPNPSEAEQLERAHLQSDVASWQALRAVLGRLPDGRRLLAAIESGEFDSWVEAQLDPGVRETVKALGQDFRRWFYRLYSQPETGHEDAWAPSYLEYQFAVSAPASEAGNQHSLLAAEQYHQGNLDWYAFDTEPNNGPGDSPELLFSTDSFEVRPPLGFVASQIEFNGMPNVRWWEFEDRQTDFGSIRAGTTDLPLLMLAEFGLIYGTDWSVIPYNLEVGTLAEIKGLVVTDVFGVRTLIRAAGQETPSWSMFDLTVPGDNAPIDHRLFLPPALPKAQESAPIEKVILARDEMTNVVWAVEDRIPGLSGHGIDGYEAATSLANYFSQQAAPGSHEPDVSAARIRYVLGSSVPENWIPFIPRHQPGSTRQIRLQRASMPRLTDAIPGSRIEPRGRLLRTGLDSLEAREAYFLHEEEVPRAGAVLSRSFQRTRWFNGKVFTWLGRRKQTGRGQSASGLEFDQVVPIGTQSSRRG